MSLPFAKPEKRATAKARLRRFKQRLIQSVRAECVERDGGCRIGRQASGSVMFGMCRGDSEWAHLGEWRRARTRGQPPEVRHSTRGSLMLCSWHHDEYDAGKIQIEYGEAGANGPLRFQTNGGWILEEAKP